ncbi:MAG: hypothetical protein GY714_32830 [Desulfobacterales bacterium]|nr:hypothetical protein [Desulfobacterales bacterium]
MGGVLSTFCRFASRENEKVTENEIIECVKAYLKYFSDGPIKTEDALFRSFYRWEELKETCDIAQLINALKKRKIDFTEVLHAVDQLPEAPKE